MTDDTHQDRWLKSGTVPVLMQMLMAESFSVREVLVDQLSRIRGMRATAALAQIALFDLHPSVREKAIAALARLPARNYRSILLSGFEHPWPVVADHAAQALVALDMKDVIPDLERLVDRPDPRAPYQKHGSASYFVKEMVRVNHSLNCLLCHPPSFDAKDKIRGRVPPTNEPLRTGREYYQSPKGIFVRADITYLKQDFSTMLKVADHGPWPAVQRFDFFVRERFASSIDFQESSSRDQAGPHEQQLAALFALRELTAQDPFPTLADRKAIEIAAKRRMQSDTTRR